MTTVASVVGLLLPATDEGSAAEVAVGLAVGITFLTIARLALRGRDIHVGKMSGAGVRLSVLVFFVLFVHSLPEGFAHRLRLGHCGAQPLRHPRDRAPEHSGGNQRRDPDG